MDFYDRERIVYVPLLKELGKIYEINLTNANFIERKIETEWQICCLKFIETKKMKMWVTLEVEVKHENKRARVRIYDRIVADGYFCMHNIDLPNKTKEYICAIAFCRKHETHYCTFKGWTNIYEFSLNSTEVIREISDPRLRPIDICMADVDGMDILFAIHSQFNQPGIIHEFAGYRIDNANLVKFLRTY